MLLTIIFISLCLSAFFSGSEIAFIASNKLKLEIDKNTGSFISKMISRFTKDPSNFIATMLVGNKISLVVFSILMTKVLSPIISQYFISDISLLFFQTIISTFIILVFAEFIPKVVCRISPNYILKIFAPFLFLFYFLLFPLVYITISLSRFLLRILFNINMDESKYVFNKIDLDDYLETVTNDSELNMPEVKMLRNALDLSSVRIRECMVPRTDMVAIDINSSIESLTHLFITTKFSKILIYKNNIDNIIGYVHSSDLFKNPLTIKSVVLPIVIVTESMSANELLNKFIRDNHGIALVVDEFGGTSGMVTIEDLTEEIVGEIQDEHDVEELVDLKIDENQYLFSSRMEVDKINEKYGLSLPESEEYETIAGLFLSYYEDMPNKKESISLNDITLIVDEVDEKSIKLIRLVIN